MNPAIAVIIIILAMVTMLLITGRILSGIMVNIRRQSLAEARAWQEEHYDLSWYDAIERHTYTVESFDNYVLHVERIVNPVPTDKYVIISHGYSDNRFGALKYAKTYLDLGYNLIVYDLRGHGENEPTICSYTVRERKDLRDLIKDTRKRYENISVLGLHGESLGGATSLAVLYYQPEVDFVVADCAFSDIETVLMDGMKAGHVPMIFYKVGKAFCQMRTGLSFKDMRPIDCLKGNKVPILFIHGENDEYIPSFHSELMVPETDGYKDLRLFPGAGHAESVLTDPERYSQCVKEFLEEVLKNN